MFGLAGLLEGRVAVVPNVIAVRDWREQAQPFYNFLAVKQGVYLIWLSHKIRNFGLFRQGISLVAEIFKDINRIRRHRRKLKKQKKAQQAVA